MKRGYKETEIGDIPIEWEVKNLGALGEWKGGGTPSKSNRAYWENGNIPWVSSLEVKEQFLSSTTYKITEKAFEETSTTRVPAGTILMVMRSGILRHTFPVAMTLFPVAINQDIKALIPDKFCFPRFLLAVLENRSEV